MLWPRSKEPVFFASATIYKREQSKRLPLGSWDLPITYGISASEVEVALGWLNDFPLHLILGCDCVELAFKDLNILRVRELVRLDGCAEVSLARLVGQVVEGVLATGGSRLDAGQSQSGKDGEQGCRRQHFWRAVDDE